jgi:hypothetical protein
VQTALRFYQEAQDAGRYVDLHAWQFTPDSFRAIVQVLNELGMVALEPLRIYSTLAGSHEFWAILRQPNLGPGGKKARRKKAKR